MYIRLAENHPVGDISYANWDEEQPLDGVCCYRAADLEEWAGWRWPALKRMGYTLDQIVEGELRVWDVVGEAYYDESEDDSYIVDAVSATDVTADIVAFLIA
jgi:hypothetical protein